MATTLATIFSSEWGATGATLFLLGGAAALVSTNLAQIAGWPCLVDDAVRICLPRAASGWSPIARRRAWLVFYLVGSMAVVYLMGDEPVALVKFAAVVDGVLLTPIQALAMLIGLYWIMPRMFQPNVAAKLKPGIWIGVGLTVSFLVFSYFCAVQLSETMSGVDRPLPIAQLPIAQRESSQ